MELYLKCSFDLARVLTENYSTSFSMSSKLFSEEIRSYVYAIYGMVRIADEIVDTFEAAHRMSRLKEFREQVYHAIDTQYSSNPILHAFAHTASKFHIGQELIDPFFDSMLVDVDKKHFDQTEYETYIHGSAEVIGLMCLKVFVDHESTYAHLEHGARKLGSAYQKINFLRDFSADYNELGRIYFPNMTYDTFDNTAKDIIVDDIKNDLRVASDAIAELPRTSRMAVRTSYVYYEELLNKLEDSSVDIIKQQRIRVSTIRKIYLLIMSVVVR